MEHFYYRLNAPRSSFPGDMSEMEGVAMRAHAEYWMALMKQGRVIALGPVGDPAGVFGVALFRAESIDAAQELAAHDPVLGTGLGFRFELYPMLSIVLPEHFEAGRLAA
ncbi:YciI family protein [Niveibacterium sp. SC-1]|uniref:YciI family protein n=1 Tax=Niveibacterium sp. SC-1 TaxID=3135646 RepID=UPI00311F1090